MMAAAIFAVASSIEVNAMQNSANNSVDQLQCAEPNSTVLIVSVQQDNMLDSLPQMISKGLAYYSRDVLLYELGVMKLLRDSNGLEKFIAKYNAEDKETLLKIMDRGPAGLRSAVQLLEEKVTNGYIDLEFPQTIKINNISIDEAIEMLDQQFQKHIELSPHYSGGAVRWLEDEPALGEQSRALCVFMPPWLREKIGTLVGELMAIYQEDNWKALELFINMYNQKYGGSLSNAATISQLRLPIKLEITSILKQMVSDSINQEMESRAQSQLDQMKRSCNVSAKLEVQPGLRCQI